MIKIKIKVFNFFINLKRTQIYLTEAIFASVGKSITWSSLNLIVIECHWMSLNVYWIYLKLNKIIGFWKLKFINIQSIKIYLKLEKNSENVGEKLL